MCPATCSRHQSTAADPCFPHRRCGHLSAVRSPGDLSRGGRHGQQSVPQGQLSNLPGVSAHLDFSTRAPRPLLLPPFRYAAFAAIQTLAHPGIRATKQLMSACWVWTGMSTDISRWSRDCQLCQRAKVTRQPHAAVQQMPIPARRFSHIHLDLVALYRDPRRVTTISSQ